MDPPFCHSAHSEESSHYLFLCSHSVRRSFDSRWSLRMTPLRGVADEQCSPLRRHYQKTLSLRGPLGPWQSPGTMFDTAPQIDGWYLRRSHDSALRAHHRKSVSLRGAEGDVAISRYNDRQCIPINGWHSPHLAFARTSQMPPSPPQVEGLRAIRESPLRPQVVFLLIFSHMLYHLQILW